LAKKGKAGIDVCRVECGKMEIKVWKSRGQPTCGNQGESRGQPT